jgi:hypothetical protein
VVLVAGKGHEDYQEIGGQRLPFSDLAQVQQACAAPGAASGAGSGRMMTLAQALQWLPGATPVGDLASRPRVHSDTRSLQPGDLFVALQG